MRDILLTVICRKQYYVEGIWKRWMDHMSEWCLFFISLSQPIMM